MPSPFSEGVARVGGGWSDDSERVEEEGGQFDFDAMIRMPLETL